MSQDFDVLFHVPYNVDQINKEDLKWIQNFESILKVSLKQIIRENIEIKNPYHTEDNLETKLKDKSIVFQFLLNNDYLPDKCLQSANSKQNHLLIQILCKPNIETDGIPVYSQIKIYDFYTISISNEYTLNVKNLDNDVWLKLLDITYEIRNYINKNSKKKDFNKKIFIAETSDDQLNNRESLIREFNHLGYKVFPDDNLPDDILTFSDRVNELMQESSMSVHIIGNEYAPLIKNMEVSKVELQNDIFSEVVASNPTIKRYVWISPKLKPKWEKQKQYIESFKRNIELLVNTEIIQMPLEVFKSILKENIDIANDNLIETKKETKSKSAYVIYTKDASERADEIKQELEKNKLNVLTTSTKGNKINLIQEHKKNLVECDFLIILYSTENEQWLNSKLSDVIKSPGFGKKNTYDLKLLLIDTDKAPKNILTIKNLEIINCNGKKIQKLLSSSIEKIK